MPAGTAFASDVGSASGLLAALTDARDTENDAAARVLEAAVGWAVMHPVESIDEAATFLAGRYGDTGIPVAGPGAPLVAEFSVLEFAAAAGLPTEAGRRLLGQAVELRYRLPRLWGRVRGREVVAWRARRVADATVHLTAEAAGFVDRHIAGVAHKTGPAQLDRLVEEAIARFMPEEVERRRRRAADGRCLDIEDQQVSFNGTSQVHGELDLADALDLQAAITRGAEELKRCGSTEPLDVRRSQAAGQLARRQLTLDLNPDTGESRGECGQHGGGEPGTAPGATRPAQPAAPGSASSRRVKARQVVLHVHVADAAVRGTGTERGRGRGLHVGRVEGHPMTLVDQVRQWCGNPDTEVVVRPVADLAGHIDVEAYEVPDRLADQTRHLNPSCVFPGCRRNARACDCDHTVAHQRGGRTCSCNTAPLCRRHHRGKTFAGWTYQRVNPTTFIWTSPHGLMYHRDHHGTLRIDTPGPADGCHQRAGSAWARAGRYPPSSTDGGNHRDGDAGPVPPDV